ncbi:MAG: hypothetical protein GC150_08990 [Rhizobiales bacterium]|nr:hypothetical protein [Hyphomicrobiales bacterium]
MTRDEAIGHIRAALKEVLSKDLGQLSEATHLLQDNVLDSLDTMNFLFKLEKRIGKKLDVIDESFTDFRIGVIADLILSEAA